MRFFLFASTLCCSTVRLFIVSWTVELRGRNVGCTYLVSGLAWILPLLSCRISGRWISLRFRFLIINKMGDTSVLKIKWNNAPKVFSTVPGTQIHSVKTDYDIITVIELSIYTVLSLCIFASVLPVYRLPRGLLLSELLFLFAKLARMSLPLGSLSSPLAQV